MKLTPPRNITFWISVVLVVLGLFGYLKVIAVFSPFAFWLVFVGFIVLMLGNLLKGL
jgi:predicted membrane channel-forming protein YqfA (hemolysin III family)